MKLMINIYNNGGLRMNYYVLIIVLFLVIDSLPLSSQNYSQKTYNNYPPKKIAFIVRDRMTQEPLENVKIIIRRDSHKYCELSTDFNGFGAINWRKSKLPNNIDQVSNINIDYFIPPATQGGDFIQNTCQLNPYINLYDLTLRTSYNIILNNISSPVADMHYHISMRSHNHFGNELYNESVRTLQDIPTNINWYKNYKKLKVLVNGKWKEPLLKSVKDKPANENRINRIKATIADIYQKSTSGTNKLTQFTQATNRHLFEGNVKLAFNAFSPFEHNVSNTFGKRVANSWFVTGAKFEWLRMIGRKNHHLSHWENFNNEYVMINKQILPKDFIWRHFNNRTNLDNDTATIVFVVEGSHILQDKYFPHSINYNIADRPNQITNKLFKPLFMHTAVGRSMVISNERIHFKADDESMGIWLKINNNSGSELKQIFSAEELRNISLSKIINYIQTEAKNKYIDSMYIEELTSNINKLKKLNGPPICMMTIAHLTYNGLMGHAPSIDGGKSMNHIIASKNYNIRVSDDPSYKKQWEKTFFTIPGVNKFGKIVIDSLLSHSNGHRILIDLKHSDLFTRNYFYDSIMISSRYGVKNDTIPPICSHCAVTGLSEEYYSPIVNEYNLSKSKFVKTFYPFGINLYDEEIVKICNNKGIIGIPLEQRILGGYINQKEVRPYYITKGGERRPVKGKSKGDDEDTSDGKLKGIKYPTQYNNRWDNIERMYTYFFWNQKDPEFIYPMEYTKDYLNVDYKGKVIGSVPALNNYKNIFRHTLLDYISVEPFLQNVFYIVDISQKTHKEAWSHICIGSDLDGLIDPIDVCPTASQYPFLRKRLEQFIPVFLKIRSESNPDKDYKIYGDYFNESFTVKNALDQLFYLSLKEFTRDRFLK